ncbi:MAG TPA: heme exporter protein CcmB [Leptospiraceae bacterium]|nr:heme exporter protein CcmB [Leptospiraceae bacterium]HRG73878.1 heme exporter protein CcmB [Leptospiraceae bacterium]
MFKYLLLKEFQLIGRAKNGLLSLISLLMAFLFIFHYSLENSGKLDINSIVGLKWAGIFLLAFILISQVTYEERESGAYRITRLYIPSHLEFLAKSFVLFFLLFLVEIFLLLLLFLFFENLHFASENLLGQFLYFIPGTLSLSFLGVTLSQMSFATRLKEVVLPILLIPLSIPVLIAGMEAERKYFSKGEVNTSSLIVLFAFSVLYLSLGLLLREVGDD